MTAAPAPSPVDDDHRLAVQLTIIIAVTVVLLNVVFYVLSGLYFDDKRASQGMMSTITDGTVSSTRVQFGIFSGITGITLIASNFAPKWVGHVVAAAFGVASLIAAFAAGAAGTPGALTVSLIVIGLLFPTLAALSLFRQSRGAWSFLCAMCWVLGVVMLFGAPKIRSQVNIGLWTAMIIPGMLMVAGIALRMVRSDYQPHR
jgi:hypothetical protein